MIKDKTLKTFPVLPDGNKNSWDFQKEKIVISIFSISITKFLAVFYDEAYVEFIFIHLLLSKMYGKWEK